MTVADGDIAVVGISEDKIFQRRIVGPAVGGEAGIAGAVGVAKIVGAAGAKFGAETQVVFADEIAGAIGELESLVGSGIEGPASVSADGVAIKTGDADFRQAEIGGIGDAGVDADALRVEVVVGKIDFLIEAVIAHVKLVSEV